MLSEPVKSSESQKKYEPKSDLEKVTEEYYSHILHYCYGKMQTKSEYASDITHEVFAILCEKWQHLHKEDIKAWLFRTADIKINEFFRKHKKTRNELTYIEDLDDFEHNRLSYHQDFENISDEEIEKHRDEILAELSDKERYLFDLFYIEKLSYKEICHELFISEHNLTKRLYRLRQKINEAVSLKINT